MNVETSNNLIDVPFEENEGSVMDCDEGDAGSVTLNEVDEATSISSLLDSVSATGAEEVIVVEVDDETMVDVDLVPQAPVSEASTETRSRRGFSCRARIISESMYRLWDSSGTFSF